MRFLVVISDLFWHLTSKPDTFLPVLLTRAAHWGTFFCCKTNPDHHPSTTDGWYETVVEICWFSPVLVHIEATHLFHLICLKDTDPKVLQFVSMWLCKAESDCCPGEIRVCPDKLSKQAGLAQHFSNSTVMFLDVLQFLIDKQLCWMFSTCE